MTPKQYAAICAVIDRAKTDGSEDTDSYATEIVEILND